MVPGKPAYLRNSPDRQGYYPATLQGNRRLVQVCSIQRMVWWGSMSDQVLTVCVKHGPLTRNYVIKAGKHYNGTQRYRCQVCKTWEWKYKYDTPERMQHKRTVSRMRYHERKQRLRKVLEARKPWHTITGNVAAYATIWMPNYQHCDVDVGYHLVVHGNAGTLNYMLDKQYLCNDLACLGCIQVILAKKIRLVEFLHELRTRSCCNVCECIACDALTILREIGEAWRYALNATPQKMIYVLSEWIASMICQNLRYR